MIDNDSETGSEGALYHYITDAYRYVKAISSHPIGGDRQKFIDDLFWRRAKSVLENAEIPDFSPEDIEDIFAQLRKERVKQKDHIWTGTLDDFEVQNASPLKPEQKDAYLTAFDADAQQGGLFKLGIEAYATYWPIHFFHTDNEVDISWGIYISEEGVMKLGAALLHAFHIELGAPPAEKDYLFDAIAYQVLLRHELEHFKIECFALNAELFMQKPIYVPYLHQVYAETYHTDSDCLEEAISNASVLNSVTIDKLFKKLYSEPDAIKTYTWREVIAQAFFDKQPYSYRNYSLRRNEVRVPIEGLQSKKKYLSTAYRKAMNRLCNQIVYGTPSPDAQEIPFDAFPPDNFFLRAESLVPIHIVKSLSDEDSFIAVAMPTQGEWQKFIKLLGYEPMDRGKGDHQVWRSKNRQLADLTLNYHGKQLDFNSFKSSLKSLGIGMRDFAEFRRTKAPPDALKPYAVNRD